MEQTALRSVCLRFVHRCIANPYLASGRGLAVKPGFLPRRRLKVTEGGDRVSRDEKSRATQRPLHLVERAVRCLHLGAKR